MPHPTTPDGRYFVVKGRLWRCTNPNLAEPVRVQLVAELMSARRAVRQALRDANRDALRDARARVHEAKVRLGERGPTWWGDGEDLNRSKVDASPYAEWWQGVRDKGQAGS